MFVRTSHEVYLEKASQFISTVVSKVKDLQFYTENGQKGGPIIMAQVRRRRGARCPTYLYYAVPFFSYG
jgi:hypothetical protein